MAIIVVTYVIAQLNSHLQISGLVVYKIVSETIATVLKFTMLIDIAMGSYYYYFIFTEISSPYRIHSYGQCRDS